MNIVVAVDDVRLRDERIEERDRSLDAIDDELSEGALQPHQTLVAGPRMHDELTDQTVIIRRDGELSEIVVSMPSTTNSPRARFSRIRHSLRVRACTMSLPIRLS